VTTYTDIVNALSEVEAFDEKAFKGDSEWPQELCDLTLALALVYNDFKDVFTGHAVLSDSAPSGSPAGTAEWGQYTGLRVHLIRIQCALIHELLELLRSKSAVLNSPAFKRVFKHLPRDEQEAWASLEDVTFHRASSRTLARALHIIRNKVAYHYDAAEIAAGYRAACCGGPAGVPRLSRGENLAGTRFYFADAAAQSAYLGTSSDSLVASFLRGDISLLKDIHHALFYFVTSFIQARGCAWRRA
jgi:hypothetical protein